MASEYEMRLTAKSLLPLTFFILIFVASTGPLSGVANVSRSSTLDSWSPRIAVDSTGNIHVVWAEYFPGTQNGEAYYSKYDIDAEEWSVPINLSNSNRVFSEEYRPVGIAIDGSDRIYVIYVEKTRISMRIFSGGSWGSVITVHSWTSGDCDSARVAVDSNGNIFTCWWTMNDFRVYSRARVGGSWESVKLISIGQSKFPDIAVGSNVAFACWTARDATSGIYQIFYTKRSKAAGSDWDAAQLMYRGSVKQQVPAIEIDSNNVAHIVYTPVLALGGQRVVRYCRWTGNGFSAPEDVSGAQLLHYPALAEHGNNLYCCWQVGAYGNGTGVYRNDRINGTWTGVGTVPDSAGVTYSDVDVSPNQSKRYYVWEADGEVWCNLGATGPAPPPPPPPGGDPVASFTVTPTSGAPPLAVTFDGSASYDSDGTIVSRSWSFGDGGTAVGPIVTHTYQKNGNFTARLTVTDDDGNTASATQVIEVFKPNEPPVADFKFTPETGIYPCEITFDAGASRDPDGSIVLYSWNFGDSGRAAGRVVKHTYTRWGTFSVSLTVQDDREATAIRSRKIEIHRLLQPLNIRWQTNKDESLFQTRYVNAVSWDPNPANDSLGVQIVLHRIWRKKTGEGDLAFKVIGEVTEDVYSYMDKNVAADTTYVYTVTVRDNQGHESPIVGGGGSPSLIQPDRDFKSLLRRNKIGEK
jgi:PKD repeat protein